MALDHLTTVNGDIVGDETYVDLGVFNQYDPYADAMNAEHTFIVTEPSVHTFYYDLEENPFTVGCMGTAIYPTYNVYLDLYQTVDAADITAEEVLLITVAFEEQSSIDGDNQGYTATTPQLNPGTYRVVKRLELDQAGLESSISQFLSLPACYEAPIQPSISCNDCWQHCFNAIYHIDGTYVYLIDENGETTLAAVGFSPSEETLSAYLLAVSNASIVSGFESDIAITNALISNCEAECETPAYHDLDWCSFYWQQMVDDLSPGGQYFDNFPGSMNEFGEAILGYNKDLWLTENIATDPLNILSSNCGSFGAFDFVSSGISTWDDLRVNWVSFNEANPTFIDNWVTYHPEYCQHESRCGVELVSTQCSAVGSVMGTFDYWTYIDNVDSYLNAGNIPSELIPILYNPLALQGFSDGDSYRSTPDGVGGQENDYTGDVQSYDCNPLNAYAIDDHDWFVAGEVDDPSDEREGIKLMIEQNLRNFIHVGNGNYMSLWYVIDNPDVIGPLDALPQNVLDLFDALHGPNGVFTQNPTEEFKLRFFHSVYRFYRDIAFLEYHENVDAPETCVTGTCSPIAGGPSDNGLDLLGGGVFGNTSDDFVLLFPQNALYNELTDGMWRPNSWSDYITNFQTNGADYILDYTTLDTFLDPINGEGDVGNDLICGIECSLVIEDAMEYIGSTYLSLSSAELSEIQSILEQLCANGCDVTMSAGLDFIGVANVTPVSFGGQSYLDINEVLNDYVVGYNDDLEFPVVLNLTETERKIACNCNNLEDIIFGYNNLNGSSLDVNGIAGDANFLVYLTENFYDPMDVLPTSIDLSDWTSECLGSYSNPLNAFPPNYNCESLFNFSADPPACEITLEEFELEQFQEDSQEYLEQQTNNFVQQYVNAWYENLEERESFRMKYTKMDYQATLYYYDQAGNLVKTVPPAGVRPLSGSDIDLVQSHRDDQSGAFMNPAHVMTTVYSYNSIQQMIKSKTPDGGDVFYWYDDLDRIIASQNDKQLAEGCFSYTLYDEIGRPYESGQACGVSIAHGVDYDHATFQLLVSSSTSKEDVNYTWFDQQVASQEVISELTNGTQDNLRNRVSMVAHIREMTPQEQPEDKYVSATVFSYDIHGNAKEAIQEFPDLHVIGEGTKRIEYDYDVFSGNVHEVKYQWGEWDQFAHRYEYDADNRLHAVYTSSNGRFWENDAKYFYYAHGPLARTEIADNQVAAQDYAYTIQGWVKGVNSATLRRNRDLGKDGLDDPNSNKVNSHFAEDSYGFVLDYFQGDFVAVTDNLIATVDNFQLESLQGFSGDLFDLYGGNISSISHGFSQEASIPQLGTMKHHTAIYRYDQLHRIKKSNYVITEMDNPTLVNNNVHPLGSILSDQFATTYSFDPNGNIETLTRNGHTMLDPADLPMDNFEYHYTYEEAYQLGQEGEYEKNRLKFVSEPQNYGSTQWTTDLDALTESDYQQQGDNYEYDEIGQIVKDANDGIGWIIWNAQNKVERVIRPDLVDGAYLEDLEFIYDQGGNRIAKIRKPRDSNGNMLDQTQWIWDYYARDPMGTELAIYSLSMMDSGIAGQYDISFKLKGEHINGSSRLGVLSDGKEVVGTLSNVALSTKTIHYDGGTSSLIDHIVSSGIYQMQVASSSNVSFSNYSGNRQFELSNHLGNVTAVLSDTKTLEYDGVSQTYVFKPRIQSLNDYYPFGMLMPGRTFAQEDYRYGFQGQETDDELKGKGNSVNYKFRMHDARIGRFLSLDPLAPKYPSNSPYAFAQNMVIRFVELEGLEAADGTELIAFSYEPILTNITLNFSVTLPPLTLAGSSLAPTMGQPQVMPMGAHMPQLWTDDRGIKTYGYRLADGSVETLYAQSIDADGYLVNGPDYNGDGAPDLTWRGDDRISYAFDLPLSQRLPEEMDDDELLAAMSRIAHGKGSVNDYNAQDEYNRRFGTDYKLRKPGIGFIDNGCEECARFNVQTFGGAYLVITRKYLATANMGLVMIDGQWVQKDWLFHVARIDNGIVFDALTGEEGMPLQEYMELWEAQDDLNFDETLEFNEPRY
ncbi:MAG: hypothetical protein MK081_15185 [Flavobacteriales bacterium]|nr:hypothetical protein [Flavobacteriales bacterium]